MPADCYAHRALTSTIIHTPANTAASALGRMEIQAAAINAPSDATHAKRTMLLEHWIAIPASRGQYCSIR